MRCQAFSLNVNSNDDIFSHANAPNVVEKYVRESLLTRVVRTTWSTGASELNDISNSNEYILTWFSMHYFFSRRCLLIVK